jgi:hypothetical protein
MLTSSIFVFTIILVVDVVVVFVGRPAKRQRVGQRIRSRFITLLITRHILFLPLLAEPLLLLLLLLLFSL